MANEAENEGSFPGAYSGQGRSWERKTREAIGLLPEKYGFQPKVVLSTRAPATITATAVAVPMCERQQLGSSYIGVKDFSFSQPDRVGGVVAWHSQVLCPVWRSPV